MIEEIDNDYYNEIEKKKTEVKSPYDDFIRVSLNAFRNWDRENIENDPWKHYTRRVRLILKNKQRWEKKEKRQF